MQNKNQNRVPQDVDVGLQVKFKLAVPDMSGVKTLLRFDSGYA